MTVTVFMEQSQCQQAALGSLGLWGADRV